MQIGILAKTFVRSTLDEVLDAVQAAGLNCVQFNMICAGLPSLPDAISPAQAARVRDAAAARGIRIAAVSGTFNMAHPDPQHRADGLRRLRVLAGACRQMGAPLITLCTGTRDREDMWRRHPDNDSPAAWRDMRETMRAAVRIAEEHDVSLGVEPEVANVVDSAVKARQLLDEIGSPNLGIVMDGANVFHAGELPRMREILSEAITLLARDIRLAHAKDLDHDGEAGHLAAGTGRLDYDHYLALLRRHGYTGALILHGLTEVEVPAAVAFLRAKLRV